MRVLGIAVLLLSSLGSEATAGAGGEAVPLVEVTFPEGTVHGFLALRSATGELLADGALLQTVRGVRVTSRLVFHFRDGSILDETAVFSQEREFRLLSDHLIQKGPAFPTNLEASFDVESGAVTVRSHQQGEDEVSISEHMELPADLSNGLLFTLLKNIRPDTARLDSHFLGYLPKPRLLRLEISAAGTDSFEVAGTRLEARHFVVHPELGGVLGAIASVFGKAPPDQHIWILFGEIPAFVRFQGSLYTGGPMWTIELASPKWAEAAPHG